jgi:hypothetical protein
MPLKFKLLSWLSKSNNKVFATRRSKPGTEHVPMPLYINPANTTHGQAITAGVVRINPVRHNNSIGCQAREYATTALTVALPIVEAVPLAGSPMKAAIGGLLAVLNIVDVHAWAPMCLHVS